MLRWTGLTFCVAVLLLAGDRRWAEAQHNWQRPAAPLERSEVEKLVGPVGDAPFSRPRHIVWVWGFDGGHQPGNHDYTRIRDLMIGMLREVPNVSLETAYLFPTQAQFDRADLVVMYLHLPTPGPEHYALLDPYLKRGGGLVALHETMIVRPRERGQQWAERIGLAWSEGESQWGALYTKVFVDNRHPIFANFSDRLEIVDEFYWRLAQTKDASRRHTLGSVPVGPPGGSRGPVPETKLSQDRYPVFWTMQHGKGRVFCSLPGHNTFTYFDPRFRIILLRGMAWAMNETPDPFMPLVYAGIDRAGRVGATGAMRDWAYKPRKLQDEGFAPDAALETINGTIDSRLSIAPINPKAAKLPAVSRIIDTHIHLYDPDREAGVPWPRPDDKVLCKPHLPEEFKRVSQAAGVTGVVIVEASGRLEDNRWVLDLVADDDFFVALVGNIDPYRKDFGQQLDRLRRDPRFVGIRVRTQDQDVGFGDPQLVANLRRLAEAGLTADILVNRQGVEVVNEIDALAREIPQLRIVVNHVLGRHVDGESPEKEWIAAVQRLAENKNVYIKVSGLYQRCAARPAPLDPAHYRPLLEILWEHFGSERLIYGSNWPCTKRSSDYATFVRLVNAFFSEKGQEASERYFWKNAVRAYQLKFESDPAESPER